MTAASSSNSAKANALLFVTVALWGSNVPLVKWLTGAFDPVLLSALRMGAASCVLSLLLLRQGPRKALTGHQRVQLMICGFFMVYLNQVFFVAGVARSTATNGTLISASNAMFGSLLAWIFLRERFPGRRMMGIALGMAGVAMVILMRPGADLAEGGLGDVMVVIATIAFVAGGVMVQRLAVDVDAVTISVGVHIVGGLCLLFHLGVQSAWTGQLPRADGLPVAWVAVILSGVVATGLGNLMWNRAIAIVGMARASVWTYWMPLFGVALSVSLLGEPLTPWHVLGLLLVLGGTRLGSR